MSCPCCAAEMTRMTLDARLSAPVEIDSCADCQAFWFDKYESLKLSAGSTLKLMKYIGEHAAAGKPLNRNDLRCPRCAARLRPINDMQRSTRFTYWRCENNHGRFIRFFEFLREKNFIRPLSSEQIAELKQHLQMVNCSNCGAPIDLETASECSHCASPISILDIQQPRELLAQLKNAEEPRQLDLLALPLELARVKRRLDASLEPAVSDLWWSDASSAGLVQAGLSSLARWLTKSNNV